MSDTLTTNMLDHYDLRTNIETRAFVLGLLHAGLTQVEAAECTEQVPARIHQLAHSDRPNVLRRRHAYLTAVVKVSGVCSSCGKTLSGSRRASDRMCFDCRRAADQRRFDDRVQAARDYGRELGYVPSAREFARHMGLGRDAAHIAVYEAFGPSPTKGGGGRRPLPEQVTA